MSDQGRTMKLKLMLDAVRFYVLSYSHTNQTRYI